MICKRCNSANTRKTKQKVNNDVFDNSELDLVCIEGDLCEDCGCFHYEHKGYVIHEFLAQGEIINNAIASWKTDQQIAKKKKYETIET